MRSWLTVVMIVALLAAIVGYSWFVFKRLRPDPFRRKALVVFTQDIDGDRRPERLRIFNAPPNGTYSLVAARGADGQLLWESSIPPMRQFTSDKRRFFVRVGDRLAIATRQFVPDPARHRHAHEQHAHGAQRAAAGTRGRPVPVRGP